MLVRQLVRVATLILAVLWVVGSFHAVAWLLNVSGIMNTLLYGPAAVGLWCFLVAPAWSYLATPVYRVFGVFKYQSAFLRTSPGNEPGSVSLHLGTLYDVLWHVVPLRRSTEPVAATVRRELYRGLSGICDRIASGDIRGEASISVCTYYLSPAQMSALGAPKTEAARKQGCRQRPPASPSPWHIWT